MKINRGRLAIATAALAAGIAALGAADVAGAEPTPTDAGRTTSQGPLEQSGPVVENERGIVLEGTGSAGDLTASVTVYENSLHGNSVQVVLGEDTIGSDEGSAPYLVDGVLHATVTIDGKEAVLSGTLVPSGRAERLVEPVQDNGEQIVTRGTHTPLTGEVTLSYGGVEIALELAPAFRYDLETRRVSLYGN